MLIVSILYILASQLVCDAAPSQDKLRIDTSILHKLRLNESLIATTGVANDFMCRVSTTTADPYREEEEFFDPHKKGNMEDCEGK